MTDERYEHGALAQQVEQLTLNQPVTGSSPVRLSSILIRLLNTQKGTVKQLSRWGRLALSTWER